MPTKLCPTCDQHQPDVQRGQCGECREALAAHYYWTAGPGVQVPERESPVLTRGHALSERLAAMR